ncbi:MAG: hypothetical protein U1E60_07025 [Reyranellaceae bacterium]
MLTATTLAPAAASASGGDDAEAAGVASDDNPDAWRFRAAAYGWLMSVSGNVKTRGQSVDLDAGFFQLFQKSDTLGALMGYFEADKGKVGVYADVVWTKLNFSRSAATYRNPLPGLTLSAAANAALTYSMTIVEMGGVYEFAKWSHGSASFTALDGLLGFRYWNNSVDLTLDAIASVNFAPLGFERSRDFAIARSGTLQWVDPLIGLRLRHQFTPQQEVFVRGDIGGFGLQSRFAWQGVAAYSYAWPLGGYQLAGVIGYRALGMNAVNGSGLNDNSVDLVLHGPIVGLSVRF